MRSRAGFAILESSLAALRLILTEKFTPHFIPIEHGIARVAQSFYGSGQITEILDITFDGLANDCRPRAFEFTCRRVECLDKVVWKTCRYLVHVKVVQCQLKSMALNYSRHPNVSIIGNRGCPVPKFVRPGEPSPTITDRNRPSPSKSGQPHGLVQAKSVINPGVQHSRPRHRPLR